MILKFVYDFKITLEMPNSGSSRGYEDISPCKSLLAIIEFAGNDLDLKQAKEEITVTADRNQFIVYF
jgi:hypothetical protein